MKKAALGIVAHNDKILLVHRKWHPILWAPAGGYLDPGETEKETVYREIWEETGVKCEVLDKIHTFTYKDEYSHSLIIVYACKYLSGNLTCSFESQDVQWFDIDKLPQPLSPDPSIFKKALEYINKNW
ncbi:NUDIX hydrolase [Lutibacter sp. B2]|nr:NUDIX hydrolase [Lutibacter sp. B2]